MNPTQSFYKPKETSSHKDGKSGLRLSILLGIVAFIAIATLGSWTLFFQKSANITIDLNQVATTQDGRLELRGLTYKGKTQKGEPFELHAKTASEDASDPKKVALTMIDGAISSNKNGPITISADQGLFNQADNEIALKGSVTIQQTNRQLVFTTEELSGNLDIGNFDAPTAVTLVSPNSVMTGDAMQVSDFGQTVRLTGQSKAIIGE